jgi:hypothetical protein
MAWTPPISRLKIRQQSDGRWIVVQESRHGTGKILTNRPFGTRQEAVAAREAIKRGRAS